MSESIYNIIPKKEVTEAKPPMYRSQHNGTIPPSASTFHTNGTTNPRVSNISGFAQDKLVSDREARSMGKQPGSARSNPDGYLMKSARNKPVKSLSEIKAHNPELLQPSKLKPRLRPGVPAAAEEAPVMNLVTSKNFVVANAVETILAAPKKVQMSAKDYLAKEDYGKTPKYLQQINQDIDAEYDYIRRLQQQRDDENQSMVRPLDENERHGLIGGLKCRWEAVNTEYQATTHLTKLDTIGKIKRKEKYETELSQIEKDIEKLNRRNINIDNGY